MGCDIYVQVERRVNGAWQVVPWTNEYRTKYLDPYALSKGAVLMPEIFDGRNYDLFGILADVRNGTWGEPNPPIAQPRGWPDDVAGRPAYGDDEAAPWLGDHSCSWVTLRELQAYPWDAPARKRGWVSHEQAAKFRADGVPPTSYAAAGNRGEYIEWTETRRKAVRNWPDVILPILETLSGPDDVRLVFGFDG